MSERGSIKPHLGPQNIREDERRGFLLVCFYYTTNGDFY